MAVEEGEQTKKKSSDFMKREAGAVMEIRKISSEFNFTFLFHLYLRAVRRYSRRR
jgi:hypothetical protein